MIKSTQKVKIAPFHGIREGKNLNLEYILVCLLICALLGLVPFFLGLYMGKPGLGKLALLCTALCGLLYVWLAVPVAIGFTVAIFIKKGDYIRPGSVSSYTRPAYSGGGGSAAAAPARGGLVVTCLSGPLRGQMYPIGAEGLMFGRDGSCGVRFPDNTGGISGRHCCIRWQQGVPVLIDLGSRYGTFQGDGRQLPQNYPVQLAAGSRFYLANTGFLFQVSAQ